MASQRSLAPPCLAGSNLDSNSRISSRVIAPFDRRTRCTYSSLNRIPAWRRYFAQARSRVTSRQVSPAVTTSALNPSSSVWPFHSAVSASSKIWRRPPEAAAAGGRRPNS